MDRAEHQYWEACAALDNFPDELETAVPAAKSDLSRLNFREAISGPEGDHFLQACEDEIGSIQGLGTYTLVERTSKMKVLPTRWVFSKKMDQNGNVVRYKARVVAKGFLQRPGIDVHEVYAPVVQKSTFRFMIALVAKNRLHMRQLDVKTAFLNGELDEEVYIEQPEGFNQGDPRKVVWKLIKALYGLRQAPRAWHKKLKSVLEGMGFESCPSDPALFVRRDPGVTGWVWVLTYVDDFLVVAKLEWKIQGVVDVLFQNFDMKDMAFPRQFVGVDVVRTGRVDSSEPYTITLHQSSLIRRTIADMGLDFDTFNASPIPMSDPTPITADPNPDNKLDTTVYNYGSLVGSLLYIATCTRPDIAFATNVLSRHLVAPAVKHGKLAMQVLRYLKGTADVGLHYSSANQDGVRAYADSDYAGDGDTRRSTTGYAILLAGGAVSYSCRCQPTVALSSMEAETQASGAAAREAIWVKNLMRDLGEGFPVIDVLGDNASCLSGLYNPMITPLSKHIDIIHHFARERVQRGELTFSKIETVQNTADIFTKPLKQDLFMKHVNGLGLKRAPPGTSS